MVPLIGPRAWVIDDVRRRVPGTTGHEFAVAAEPVTEPVTGYDGHR